MHKCDFCGSSFGDRICYFCDKTCCTTCMVDDRTRCKDCYIKKQKLGLRKLLKKNKVVLIFIAILWCYAVYPGPFIPGLNSTFYTITLVAALLIMIPLGLALFFWSLNPPASDIKRKD
jgi:hypothetical protein